MKKYANWVELTNHENEKPRAIDKKLWVNNNWTLLFMMQRLDWHNPSLNYPLVDGYGNFGNIDGDPSAHYRYCLTGSSLIKLIKEPCLLKN